jgi:hypothetical protein
MDEQLEARTHGISREAPVRTLQYFASVLAVNTPASREEIASCRLDGTNVVRMDRHSCRRKLYIGVTADGRQPGEHCPASCCVGRPEDGSFTSGRIDCGVVVRIDRNLRHAAAFGSDVTPLTGSAKHDSTKLQRKTNIQYLAEFGLAASLRHGSQFSDIDDRVAG